MEMRQFYQKIHEIESDLPELFVVVVSLETPDGGVAGSCTEVTRRRAAQMIVEQRARLATAPEEEEYRRAAEQARIAAEKALQANAHFTLLSDADLRTLRSGKQKS